MAWAGSHQLITIFSIIGSVEYEGGKISLKKVCVELDTNFRAQKKVCFKLDTNFRAQKKTVTRRTVRTPEHDHQIHQAHQTTQDHTTSPL
jgi:hypothetical protein